MEQLKKLRKERGLNQAALAKHLDISVSAYVNYELGQRQPSIENLNKIADFYGVSVDYLIGHKKSPDSKFTDEDYANGVTDKARIEINTRQYEWLELGDEAYETKGEEYYNALYDMIKAAIRQKQKIIHC